MREYVQLLPCASKHSSGSKRQKTFNRSQAQENINPVPSAEKHATGTELFFAIVVIVIVSGLFREARETRENIQPVPRAEKHSIGLVKYYPYSIQKKGRTYFNYKRNTLKYSGAGIILCAFMGNFFVPLLCRHPVNVFCFSSEYSGTILHANPCLPRSSR